VPAGSQLWSAGVAALAAVPLATGLPPAVKVSQRGSAVAWSEPAPGGGFKLVVRVDGIARDAAVAPSRRPFDVDLGDDGHGHLIATYSRCTGAPERTPPRGCDVYAYRVTTGHERRVAGLGRGAASDHLPTAARGRIAFARSVRGGHPRLHVRSLDGGPLRALPFGRRQRGSGPTGLDLGARGLALAWQRPADYGSQQVRYDPLSGRSKVLATYYGGALAGTDVVGVSATPTGVLWGTAGYGESIGFSRLHLVPRPGAPPQSLDPGIQLTSVSGTSLADAVALTCDWGTFGPENCSVVLLRPHAAASP
jgi:hypothetical protein